RRGERAGRVATAAGPAGPGRELWRDHSRRERKYPQPNPQSARAHPGHCRTGGQDGGWGRGGLKTESGPAEARRRWDKRAESGTTAENVLKWRFFRGEVRPTCCPTLSRMSHFQPDLSHLAKR